MLNKPRRDPMLLLPLPWDPGSSVSWPGASHWHGARNLQLEHYRLTTYSLVAITEHGRKFEEEVHRALAVARRIEERSSEEEPEVLDLQPLSRRAVTARIARREPARFYLVDSDPEHAEASD